MARLLPSTFTLALLVFGIIGLWLRVGAGQPWGKDVTAHVVGVGGAVSLQFVSRTMLRRCALWIATCVLLSLVLVEFTSMGVTLNGATRWLDLEVVTVQPSEFAKPAIALCGYLAVRMASRWTQRAALACCACVVVFIAFQPSVGSGIVVGVMTFTLGILFSGLKRPLIPFLVLGGVMVAALTAEHVRVRLLYFLSAPTDRLGGGYQVAEASQAIARGGFFGSGASPEAGVRLPSAFHDFALATATERFGLVVVVPALVLLAFGTHRALTGASRRQSDMAVTLLVVLAAVLPAVLNAMSVLGIMPVVGLPFPFLSSGGSSILACWLLLGLHEHSRRVADVERSQEQVE